MADLVLNVELGRDLGSASARRLRSEDKVPGVVYGLAAEPVSVAVVYSELRTVLTTDAGLNALITLNLGGDSHLSIVKELQRHPTRDEVTHVDFLRVDATQELEVDVPIVLRGDARKVTDENGMVDQAMFNLTVFASPDSIPNELVIDITEMELNDQIRVGDIQLPTGVRTEIDPEEAIAIGTVTRSTMEAMAEEEAAEAADAIAGLEGEEGEAEGAEGSGDDDGGGDE